MDLKDYLKSNKIKVVELAEAAGVCKNTIYKCMRHENIDLRLAFTISRATKGKVKLTDMEPYDLSMPEAE